MRTVNVKGESVVKGGKCTTEKISPRPHTVTHCSSTHQLPSNLIPSLELSLVSAPTNFDSYVIDLQEQQLFFDNCST